MKAEYINAYIVATQKLFDVMFNISRFEREIFTASHKPGAQYDVSGIIGVTGDCTGIVVLTFARNVALKMVSQMLGEEISESTRIPAMPWGKW
jgi:chemotaxis protein CheX